MNRQQMADYTGEKELLDAIRSGNSSAFRKVYVLHFNMVRYLIIKNNGREEDARDIFQECMIALYEQLAAGKFLQTASLKTWIYAVCRNKWLRQLQKNKKNTRFTDFENYSAEIILPEEEKEPDVHLLLRKSLKRLGVGCRKLLLLFYYFKKNMTEIASELNYTNADNAKNQKYKCLQKLKEIYKTNAATENAD